MNKWYIEKGPESDVVISTRIRLARNYKDFPFPQRADPEQLQTVILRTNEAIFTGNLEMEKNFSFIDISKLSNIDKMILIEKHIISKELVSNQRESGVVISNDEKISIMINEEDHLRIQCLASGMQLEKAHDLCSKIDNLLEEKIEFAFREDYGYLTCCPSNIGTGIRASVMLHLPALTMTGYIRSILDACGKLGVAVRGLYGENTEATGNMFQLSNQVTLGKNEKDIILGIKNITYQIIEQERALRNELLKQNKTRFEDKIFRSLGILKSARLINTEESLKKLSDIRLGVEMGLINDVGIESVNSIMLAIQPGNLQKNTNDNLKPDERDALRAEIIRNYLN